MQETVPAADLSGFLEKVERRTLRPGVVGLGYVGLPLTQLFANRGFRVIGIDIDSNKTTRLMRGESYIRHIPSAAIAEIVEQDRLMATADFSRGVGSRYAEHLRAHAAG